MDDNTFPDVGAMNDQELKDLITTLTEEERTLSYRRRMLHGKIDILRAELVTRLHAEHQDGEALIKGDDVDKLSRILAGEKPISDEADGPALP